MDSVHQVIWSPTEENILSKNFIYQVSSSSDKTLKFWDIRTSKNYRSDKIKGGCFNLSWSSDNNYLAYTNKNDDVLSILDIRKGIVKQCEFKNQVNEFHFDKNMNCFIVCMSTGNINFYCAKTFNFSANTSNSVTDSAIASDGNTQTFYARDWGKGQFTSWYARIGSGTRNDLLLTYTYIDTSGNEQEKTLDKVLTEGGFYLDLGITINSWSVDGSLGVGDKIYITANTSITTSYFGGTYKFTNNSLFTCPNNAIAWVQNVSFNSENSDVLRLFKWKNGVRSVMFAFNTGQNFNVTASGEYGFGGYIKAGETIGWGSQATGYKTVYANIVCRYI